MKIEDMVMVIYNQKGIEKNFLCSFENFVKNYAMTRKITTAGGKKYAYYICSNHKMTKQCSQHSISVSLLEDTVLEMLKLHIKNVMNLEYILYQNTNGRNYKGRKV